jgi:hypothetical protein
LAGLGKNIKNNADKRRKQTDKDLSIIQTGASLKSKDCSNAKFKRYTFSLTLDISERIDSLTLRSRTQRITRSDIVKIGTEALNRLDDKEFESIVTQAK